MAGDDAHVVDNNGINLGNDLPGLIRNILCEENNKLKAEFEQTVRFYSQPLFDRYNVDIDNLKNDLQGVKLTAENALAATVTNTANIENLSTVVNELQQQQQPPNNTPQQPHNNNGNADLAERVAKLEKKITTMNDELDDLRNRCMRGNLVFQGIPETEGQQDETSTKDLMAQFLLDNCNAGSLEAASNYIVRAHRSRKNKDDAAAAPQPDNKPRPIYVKFSRDDIAEFYLMAGIENKVTNRGFKVSKQYTVTVQKRRDEALKLRRELIDRGKITKAFIEYPATLKAVRTGEARYSTIRKF